MQCYSSECSLGIRFQIKVDKNTFNKKYHSVGAYHRCLSNSWNLSLGLSNRMWWKSTIQSGFYKYWVESHWIFIQYQIVVNPNTQFENFIKQIKYRTRKLMFGEITQFNICSPLEVQSNFNVEARIQPFGELYKNRIYETQ